MAISEKDVCSMLSEGFPELHDDLQDECLQGIHLQLSCLMRATQAAISDGDREFLKRAFKFADDLLRTGDGTVKNAVAVSFLEHLTFSDTKKRRRSWAFELMTSLLQQEYREVMAYWERLNRER